MKKPFITVGPGLNDNTTRGDENMVKKCQTIEWNKIEIKRSAVGRSILHQFPQSSKEQAAK